MVQSLVGVGAAFAMALWMPGVAHVLGLALFGVAHVASETRFLVVRRSLQRAWIATLVAGCAALFAIRLAGVILPSTTGLASAEVTVGWSLPIAGAIAGGLVAGRGTSSLGVALVSSGVLVTA